MSDDPEELDWLAQPPSGVEPIEDLRGVIDDLDGVRPDEMTDFYYVHAYNTHAHRDHANPHPGPRRRRQLAANRRMAMSAPESSDPPATKIHDARASALDRTDANRRRTHMTAENASSAEPATLTASIDEQATGAWQITTETGSVYVLDLDQRLLTRVPELRAMRRDHEPLHLHRLIEARVGASGRLLVQVRDDTIPTIRLTSPIVAIHQLRTTRGGER